ncbi:MAG: hypothetical protein OEY67_03985 [Gammaproteobacteria bacterium]|nr:hypothetical protein [Gammaproteobacteria bacterium]
MPLKYLSIFLIFGMMISGCASGPTTPANEVKVKVGVKGGMLIETLQVKVYEGESCNELIKNRPPVMTSAGSSVEVGVPFGRRMSTQFQGVYLHDNRRLRCSIRISFIPMAGSVYQMDYEADAAGCNVAPRRHGIDTLGKPSLEPVPSLLNAEVCQ